MCDADFRVVVRPKFRIADTRDLSWDDGYCKAVTPMLHRVHDKVAITERLLYRATGGIVRRSGPGTLMSDIYVYT
jgi:hypothetical protein